MDEFVLKLFFPSKLNSSHNSHIRLYGPEKFLLGARHRDSRYVEITGIFVKNQAASYISLL